MSVEHIDTFAPERQEAEEFQLELAKELLNAPEKYQRLYIKLSLAQRQNADPDIADFLNPLNFVSSMKIAEQIGQTNQDERNPDFWIPENYVWHWRSITDKDGLMLAMRLDAGIEVPYAERQTDESMRAVVNLLPEMAEFKDPLL